MTRRSATGASAALGRCVAAVAAVATAVAALAMLGSRPAASQGVPGGAPGMALQHQTFAVRPGERAQFEYVVNADVPEITTTTTTTTTTSTTTTTTTTTTPPTTVSPLPGAAPPPGGSTVAPATSEPEPTSPPTPPPTTVPPGPTMEVRLRGHRPIQHREQIDRAYDGFPTPTLDSLVIPLEDAAELVDGVRRLSLDVLVTDAAPEHSNRTLDLPDPGLHPVTVEILKDGAVIQSDRTFLERLPEDGPGRGPLQLAVVAGVDDPGPEVTQSERLRALPRLVEVAAVARAAGGVITAAIPPSLVESILAGDPDLARELADALAAGELIELPALPLDASSVAAADAASGSVAQGGPRLADQLTAERQRGVDQLRNRLPGVATTSKVWLVESPITAAGARLLGNHGVDTLVVPYDHYHQFEGNIGGFTDPSLLIYTDAATTEPIDMMVVDSITQLLDPERVPTDTTVAEAIRLMASMSAVRYQLRPDVRGLVLAAPDFGVPDADVIAALAGIVDQHPDMSFVRLSELSDNMNHFFLDGEPLTVSLDPQPEMMLADRVSRIRALELHAADAASMLSQADTTIAGWAESLNMAASTGVTDAEATALLDSLEAEIADVRSWVQPPESFNFTLASKHAEVPLRITNTGPVPVTVRIRLTAEKLEMPDGDLEVTLEPGVGEIDVPVEARSNGRFPVTAELFTPLGNRLTEPVELQARVNTLTGIGYVVTVGAGLVLASWWFAHYRRKRRERRADAAGNGGDRTRALTTAELSIESRRVESLTIDATTDASSDVTVQPVDEVPPADGAPTGTGPRPADSVTDP